MEVLFIILITLYPVLDAIGDTLFHHFYVSVFKDLNIDFWNPNVSWETAKRIPILDYPLDAWHICKSLKIFSMIAAIIVANSMESKTIDIYLISFTCIGLYQILIFNLFYEMILESKDGSI